MNRGQRSEVKCPPGMGSAPVESRLREVLLPPPMEGLKMGVLGTTVALTVAAREKTSRLGRGGRGTESTAQPSEAARPSPLSEPQGIFPLLPCSSSYPRGSRPGRPSRPVELLCHLPGRGTSCVPSEGGMVKPDSQMGEFAP